jgi:hypothetical protein
MTRMATKFCSHLALEVAVLVPDEHAVPVGVLEDLAVHGVVRRPPPRVRSHCRFRNRVEVPILFVNLV